jgi:hypothetical protein
MPSKAIEMLMDEGEHEKWHALAHELIKGYPPALNRS